MFKAGAKLFLLVFEKRQFCGLLERTLHLTLVDPPRPGWLYNPPFKWYSHHKCTIISVEYLEKKDIDILQL